MPPLFSLRSLRKLYDGEVALEVSSLDIEEGESYSLIGPNGSGKSTLLQVLAFLSAPTSGELFYQGKKVAWDRRNMARLRRGVTLLHQTPLLFEGTVYSNVAFGLTVIGIRGERRRERIAGSLDMVGMNGSGNRKARTLSGGETQRVAMARVLALNPRVLLLDEPLANVDGEHAPALREMIVSLPRRGTTVIVSTHETAQPLMRGSRVIQLAGGRLKEDSPRSDMCAPRAEGSGDSARI